MILPHVHSSCLHNLYSVFSTCAKNIVIFLCPSILTEEAVGGFVSQTKTVALLLERRQDGAARAAGEGAGGAAGTTQQPKTKKRAREERAAVGAAREGEDREEALPKGRAAKGRTLVAQ